MSRASSPREAGNQDFFDKISGFINVGSETKEFQNALLAKGIHVSGGGGSIWPMGHQRRNSDPGYCRFIVRAAAKGI